MSFVISIEVLEEKLNYEAEFLFDPAVWQEIEDVHYCYTLKKKSPLYLGCELPENGQV